MKLRAAFVLMSTVLLAGCSGTSMPEISNPFEQPSITESYISQFSNVPIPAPMSSKVSETLVTVAPDGSKFGLESFSGRVDGTSLANVMMQNMTREGWQLRGSSVGVRSVQLYEKSPHYACLFFRKGVVNTTMDVWIINGVNVDVLSLVPEVSGSVTGSAPALSSPSAAAPSSSAGNGYAPVSSDKVKKLSE